MSVTLTPEVESMVAAKVASGNYSSPDEVFRVALQLLNEYEQVQAQRFAELRREVLRGVEQIEQGKTRRVTLEEMVQRLEQRLSAEALPQTEAA